MCAHSIYLNEGNADGVLLDHFLQWLANSRHKGVRQDKDENVGVTSGVEQVRVGDDVLWQLVSRKVLDVLMLAVDDLTQLFAIHHLLVDVHANLVRKVRVFSRIRANDFGDSRAPFGRDTFIIRSSAVVSLSCHSYQLPEPMMATLRIVFSKNG